jgi:hypothetical protein
MEVLTLVAAVLTANGCQSNDDNIQGSWQLIVHSCTQWHYQQALQREQHLAYDHHAPTAL